MFLLHFLSSSTVPFRSVAPLFGYPSPQLWTFWRFCFNVLSKTPRFISLDTFQKLQINWTKPVKAIFEIPFSIFLSILFLGCGVTARGWWGSKVRDPQVHVFLVRDKTSWLFKNNDKVLQDGLNEDQFIHLNPMAVCKKCFCYVGILSTIDTQKTSKNT